MLQGWPPWRVAGTVGRTAYFCWGVSLLGVKVLLDTLVGRALLGASFSPLDVYVPIHEELLSQRNAMPLLALALVAVPFLWMGVALTLRRLRSAGLPSWLALIFFVPWIKLALFAALCIAPQRVAPGVPRPEPTRGGLGRTLAWFLTLLAVALGGVLLGTYVLRDYAASLFMGIPFGIGFVSAAIVGRQQAGRLTVTILLAMLATAAFGGALMLSGIEGGVCLVMAAPIGFGLTGLGAGVGYCVLAATERQRLASRSMGAFVLLLPASMGLESAVGPEAPLFSVSSSVTVKAPPEVVWRHVVSFSELPPPDEPIFRTGVAYPIRAEIEGVGPGAVRHCVFSTGAFVEPIETWDEPRLLEFTVASSPPPMAEWSPWGDIHPPHLDGFFVSERGQFRLEPLPDGGTLLVGTTWYRHHMQPAGYWRVWSDLLMHRIHLRVLRHVKALAEAPAA